MSNVDDILVGGRSKEEYDKNLGLVLQRLNSMQLHVNENKMQFAREEVLFLEYDIRCGGYCLTTYISEQSSKSSV